MPENTLLYHLIVALVIVVVFVLSSRLVRLVLGSIGKRLLAWSKIGRDVGIFGVHLDHSWPLLKWESLRGRIRSF